MDRVMKDDHDVVPVPRAIIEAVTKKSGPLNGEGPLFRGLVAKKSSRRAGMYISRSSAKELLVALDGTNLPGLPAWRALVAAEDVGWDVVVEQSPCGKETVYDLVVPETKVFSVEGGLVVWDTMGVYVPITPEAVADARRMMPSNNLFSEATGKVMYQPSNEAAMGLFRTTMVGETTVRMKFDSPKAVLDQLDKGTIKHTDQVILNGKRTTAGRILLSERLPESYREQALHDFSFQLNKQGIEKLYTELGTKHRHEFGQWADKIKDLGYDAATGIVRSSTLAGPVSIGAHTLSLKDIAPAKGMRDTIFDAARKQEDRIRADSTVPVGDKDRRVVDTWISADEQVKRQYQAQTNEHSNNLALLWKSGVKPGWAQLKQITLSPTLVMDSRNKVIPTAITKSYTEGLDLAGYWTQMHGARRGAVMKTMEVREPGYLSKLLQNTSMDIQVTKEDCGTTAGVAMSLQEPDISGRYLQAAYKGSGFSLPAGTLLTPAMVTKIRTADKGARLLVRSPLKCSLPHGLCQKCAGLGAMDQSHPLGTNLGVISAHALGERAVQLPLKSFHCMHEHSTVLVRRKGRIYHSTLGRIFDETPDAGVTEDGEIVRPVSDLEVWDMEGWVKVRSARRHLQMPGTAMTFTRTRAGYGIISQDNHPHMLVENTAVCPSCRTWPKKIRDGKIYYCRKCRRTWQGQPQRSEEYPSMVPPSDIWDKSHTAWLERGPTPTNADPPMRDGWLAGVFVAEGCIHARQENGGDYVMGITFSQNVGHIHDLIGHAWHQEYGEDKSGSKVGYQFYGRERALQFVQWFGRYSRNVGLPPGWSGFPREWLLDFVAGAFDGDGTLVRNDDSAWLVGRIDTTSILAAQQIHWILRGAGVPARMILTPWRRRSLHQGYAVTFPITEHVKQLLGRCTKLAKVKGRPVSNDERFADVVDYIRPVNFRAPPMVYDLETETGTLFVGGMWTHNTGGSVGGDAKGVNAFVRFQQLTEMPKKIPNAASLAMTSGTVEAVTEDRTGVRVRIGGVDHFVGKDATGMALHKPLPDTAGRPQYKQWGGIAVGTKVEAGDHLSDPNRTNVNPHDYFAATKSIDKTRNLMVDEIHGLYSEEGLRRRNIETVVRAMTNLTEVQDPGDHGSAMRGERFPLSYVQHLNANELKGKNPIQHTPVLAGVDMLPLEMRSDWMAKLNHQRLSQTLQDAGALAQKSSIHGSHPVPSLMYGAEFGLSSTSAKGKPGYEHLKDVPGHHY
jgi:ribosomal protein L37AE/L43A